MDAVRLDIRDKFPSGFEEYLSQNGWHFNKKLCEFAVSKMTSEDPNGNEIKKDNYSKNRVDDLLKRYGINIKNGSDYDKVYVANMGLYDFYSDVIVDEHRLAKFIKKYIDDIDGYDGLPLTRYYADCIGKGVHIEWEEML